MPINIDSHQIFSEYELNKIDINICLSDNSNTGLFLKENPHLIRDDLLNKNKNDWAIDFLIENNLNICPSNLHDKAVDYYIVKNSNKIHFTFSENENDKAVDYLISNEDKIFPVSFATNKNDKAVEYILKNADKYLTSSIIRCYFYRNPNIKVINYILDQNIELSEKIKILKYNENDKAVEFIIKNIELCTIDDIYDFIINENEKAVEYIIKMIKEDNLPIPSKEFKKNFNENAQKFIENNPQYFE